MEIKNRDDFLIFLQNFINETDAREFENNTILILKGDKLAALIMD